MSSQNPPEGQSDSLSSQTNLQALVREVVTEVTLTLAVLDKPKLINELTTKTLTGLQSIAVLELDTVSLMSHQELEESLLQVPVGIRAKLRLKLTPYINPAPPQVSRTGVAKTLATLVKTQDPHVRINPHVVDRAIKRYPGQVTLVITSLDPLLALNIYQDAERLPATYTELELANDFGYQINGNVIRDNDNLIICFKDTTPYILKLLTSHEYNAMQQIKQLLPAHNHIIPIQELIQAKHGKAFAIMPILPTTLEGLISLSPQSAFRFWKQMKSALEAFHQINFAHGDVKPTNICLTSNGDFVLIDLGSVAQFGSRVTSTAAYHPKIAKDSNMKFNIASPALDWWMLAAVVTERACGLDWGGISNPTPEKMFLVLSEKVPNIWSELREKLEPNM